MDFTSQDSQEIIKNFKSIISSRLDKLYNEKGTDGELYAYSIAVANQKKKKAKETTPDTTMENSRLREMVIDALTEKKKPFPDLTGDNKVTKADILKARGVELEEDLDLGHQDNEPHMLKADLYRIGKYAMELYKMLDQFEGPQEVDLPHWWQSKIIKSKELLVSAKHYLDFELKEPQIDAMVDVAAQEDAIDEGKMTKKEEKIVKGLKKSGFKKDDPEMYAIAKAKAKEKIKEAILANLKNK
jgi:hypothetical protein